MRPLLLAVCLLVVAAKLSLSREGFLSPPVRVERRFGVENVEAESSRGWSRRSPRRSSRAGGHGPHGFDHDYAKPMRVECNTRRGEAVYRVESEQTNGNYDRIWKWGCRRVVDSPLTSCRWTDEINDWNGPISFMCPMNQVMAGVSSQHAKYKEDRRWRVQCCRARGYHTEGCTLTKFLNKRGELIRYRSKSNCQTTRVFTGFVTSFYLPHDREWKILECALTCDDRSRVSPSRSTGRYRQIH